MIHTTGRTRVYEVTFLPKDRSEPEVNRHPIDDEDFLRIGDRAAVVDYILQEYERAEQEVISVIYIRQDGSLINLYGNRRYL